jgi:hypothetical protein
VSSWEIVQTIICKLTNIPSEKDNIIKTKVSQLCQKNKGYQKSVNVGIILCGNNKDFKEYFTLSVVLLT